LSQSYERMVLLFNGDEPGALALARSTWTDCKTRGFEVAWTTSPRAGIYTFTSGRLSSIEGTPEAPVAPKPAKPKAKKKAAT
jgi:hypothetical protein